MWPFKRKKSNRVFQLNGPLCSYCRSTRTIVVASQSAGQSDYIKTWRGQRYLTCRCLNCGKEFYADEPREGLPEMVLTHDNIIDDDGALRAAEDDLIKLTEDENDRRCR